MAASIVVKHEGGLSFLICLKLPFPLFFLASVENALKCAGCK